MSGGWSKTRWKVYAPVYDWVAKPLEKGRKRAIERLELEKDDRVLILGCGTGMDIDYFPDGVEVTALDLVPTNVKRTEARGKELNIDVEGEIGDAQNLPFKDRSFDVVLLHLVLSVVPEPHKVGSETERVLAQDGRVSIYDKFVPEDEKPSLPRRAFNPIARFFFSDLTRSLEPIFSDTDLEIQEREKFLRGLYTVTIARPKDV